MRANRAWLRVALVLASLCLFGTASIAALAIDEPAKPHAAYPYRIAVYDLVVDGVTIQDTPIPSPTPSPTLEPTATATAVIDPLHPVSEDAIAYFPANKFGQTTGPFWLLYFPYQIRSQMAAISWCESSWDPYARNGKYNGLFQEEPYWYDRYGYSYSLVFDPHVNAQIAYLIWQESGYGPWECKP